jgi:hypothetical protein
MVGGKFEIESAPGHGTTISAEIPMAGKAPKGPSKTSRKTRRTG